MSWTFAISLTYVALGALGLTLYLATPHSTNIKATIIAAISGFYILTFIGLAEIRGWAIEKTPPNPFKLHWAVVEEPNKATGTEGQIYILAQALGEYEELISAPRLYVLPFSAALAQQVEDAKKQIEEGQPIEGTFAYKAARQDKDDRERRRDEGVEKQATGESDQLILQFRDLPRPDLPAKGR